MVSDLCYIPLQEKDAKSLPKKDTKSLQEKDAESLQEKSAKSLQEKDVKSRNLAENLLTKFVEHKASAGDTEMELLRVFEWFDNSLNSVPLRFRLVRTFNINV